jgi:hypothetical protein
VWVQGKARRNGQVVLRCVRDEVSRFPVLEIPAWMFDSSLCCQKKQTIQAHVSSSALLELKELLASAVPSIASSIAERSIFPAVQEMPMRTSPWPSLRQGELFSPPAKLLQLPPEVQQRTVRLLARMLREHLNRQLYPTGVQAEVGDE